jgi:hypothetical protein
VLVLDSLSPGDLRADQRAEPALPDRRPATRTWPRRLATAALALLTVTQLTAALFYLLVLTTVPQRDDLRTGMRSVVVGAQPAPSPAAAAPTPAAAPAPAAVRATELSIAKLRLRQPLVGLDVDASGVLQPPSSPDLAGWFIDSAVPGETGPTVLAGHVDSTTGPGVFVALKNLAPGDLIDIGRSDGHTAHYRVTAVQAFDKTRFPTDRVYGPTTGAELRVVTCGGAFDRATGHYERNVIIFGVAAES